MSVFTFFKLYQWYQIAQNVLLDFENNSLSSTLKKAGIENLLETFLKHGAKHFVKLMLFVKLSLLYNLSIALATFPGFW